MKKTLHFFILMLCIVQFSDAQDWTVYDGSVTPEDPSLGFEVNDDDNVAFDLPSWTARPGGVLTMLSGGVSGENDGTYRQMSGIGTGGATAITIVSRLKAVDATAYNNLIEFDLRFAGFREKLVISGSGKLDHQRASTDLSGGTLTDITPDVSTQDWDVSEWHTYRFTYDAVAGEAKTYVDENPTPVLATEVDAASTDDYWRYGDGSGSNTYSANFDWIAYDISRAYSPSASALPDQMKNVSTWFTYTGDVSPGTHRLVLKLFLI